MLEAFSDDNSQEVLAAWEEAGVGPDDPDGGTRTGEDGYELLEDAHELAVEASGFLWALNAALSTFEVHVSVRQ
jgi:hypothetical protein